MNTRPIIPAEKSDDTHENESRVPVPSGYKDSIRYRERSAGTGYGRSSGYARNRTYAEPETGKIFNFG
jgi:hypothetical protein